MKFNHVGIPTTTRFDGEIPLPHLQMTVSDHQDNPFGIQWQRYWEGAPYPELVKSVAHVAFEVDDLEEALKGHHILIEPNNPSRGVRVAFIQVRTYDAVGRQQRHESAVRHQVARYAQRPRDQQLPGRQCPAGRVTWDRRSCSRCCRVMPG